MATQKAAGDSIAIVDLSCFDAKMDPKPFENAP